MYLSWELGQARFARRWEIGNRTQIFSMNPKGLRRSWIQMLGLPLRSKGMSRAHNKPSRLHLCEICGNPDTYFDKAPWVDRAKGGSSRAYNILRSDVKCHRRLDRNEKDIILKAKRSLLLREVRKLVESIKNETELKVKLLQMCEAIIFRKPLEASQ